MASVNNTTTTVRLPFSLITMSLDSAIASLVSRLETVTARLEKVEGQLASGAVVGGGSSSAGSSAGGDAGSSQSVQEYDNLVSQYITPYVELSGKIDPALKAQVCINIIEEKI